MHDIAPERTESRISEPRRALKLRPLEVVGIVAVAVLVLSALFDVDIAVKRKPAFEKVFGRRTSVATPAPPASANTTVASGPSEEDLELAVLPSGGVEIPVTWGSLGKQLVDAGVIDQPAFERIYAERGGLTPEMQQLLTGTVDGKLRMTSENSGYLLNLLWALGIGNENVILTSGPMSDPKNGGAGNFASTGGWTLAKGDAMTHYSKHAFARLTPEQQALVERVSKGIYRPCCGNSVHFPDCNHGMAMLGLLELMAAQGVGEEEMYRVALQVNAYWFPTTYLTIAKYFAKQGLAWNRVDPKLALGQEFSSSQGYRRVLAEVEPAKSKGGGGCGV